MDIKELLRDHNISFREYGTDHHVSQGWIGLQCPWCGKHSGKYHLGFNLSKIYTSCYKCGYHPAYRTLAELLGIRYHEARELLGGFDPGWEAERGKTRGEICLPAGVGPLLPPHVRYLEGRGFDVRELERLWGIQGIGFCTKLAWRIWIPVHQYGVVVSWTTRSLTNMGCRYVSAKKEQEAIPSKTLLYGADYARNAIIVCEGPTDVWRIGPGAVATLGIKFTPAQVEQIAKYPVRAICFDNQWDAQRKAKELSEKMQPFPGRTYNVVLSAKDPGSASEREVEKLRRTFLE